jgi:hypothetical protein
LKLCSTEWPWTFCADESLSSQCALHTVSPVWEHQCVSCFGTGKILGSKLRNARINCTDQLMENVMSGESNGLCCLVKEVPWDRTFLCYTYIWSADSESWLQIVSDLLQERLKYTCKIRCWKWFNP